MITLSNPFAASFHSNSFGIQVKGRGALVLGQMLATLLGCSQETKDKISQKLSDDKSLEPTKITFGHISQPKVDKTDKAEKTSDDTKAEKTEKVEPVVREFVFSPVNMARGAEDLSSEVSARVQRFINRRQRSTRAAEQQASTSASEVMSDTPESSGNESQ